MNVVNLPTRARTWADFARNLPLREIIRFAAKLERNGKDALCCQPVRHGSSHGHKLSQHVCTGACAPTTALNASMDPPSLLLPAQAPTVTTVV